MAEIKLEMRNRTKFNLIFHYNNEKYEIAKGMSRVEIVESGHRISVNAPIGSRVKVKYREHDVEGDLFVSELEKDIVIVCRLVAWQLQLQIG